MSFVPNHYQCIFRGIKPFTLCIQVGLNKLLGHFIPVTSSLIKKLPSSLFIVCIVFNTNKGQRRLMMPILGSKKEVGLAKLSSDVVSCIINESDVVSEIG